MPNYSRLEETKRNRWLFEAHKTLSLQLHTYDDHLQYTVIISHKAVCLFFVAWVHCMLRVQYKTQY